ncbi:HPP family protein [Nocardioides sp. SR21]|uniref:CBS domain-containing protein n=1 Tax=Nocardioides sp. SR21 TaxID=2919501 RepID=UPI001FAA9C85|nr:CBS domain-containing protein [Nocardioides sp. SR21]
MLVHDLMTPAPATLHPGTHLDDALSALARLGVTSMPVVDDQGWLLGIVSEVDLIRGAVAHDPDDQHPGVVIDPQFQSRIVGDVYTRDAVCARACDDIATAVEAMVAASATCLPVLNEVGQLVGVISRRDVVKALVKQDEAMASELDGLIGEECLSARKS